MKTTQRMAIILIVLCTFLLWDSAKTVQALEKDDKVIISVAVFGEINRDTLKGFKEGLQANGYIEGKNVTYVFDGPYRDITDLSSGVEKLMAYNPDLIFAASTLATMEVQKATIIKKVPVVFGLVNDPIRAGIIKEQEHPGDNITGVMLSNRVSKRLEWTIKTFPAIKTILLPYNPEDRGVLISLRKIEKIAEKLKVKLITREVRNDADIDALLGNFPTGIEAIFLVRSGIIIPRVEEFARLAKEKKLILCGTPLEIAEKGALFGFGVNTREIGIQMSRLADKILKGINPGDLPVETAEDYLAVNLKTAKAIGMRLEEEVLRQAHTIISPE
jgi:putative ABC transport system substrate-binding protein